MSVDLFQCNGKVDAQLRQEGPRSISASVLSRLRSYPDKPPRLSKSCISSGKVVFGLRTIISMSSANAVKERLVFSQVGVGCK